MMRMTAQEYLEWESQQEEKHEFHDGIVYKIGEYPIPPDNPANHNRILVALISLASPLATSAGYEVFALEMGVCGENPDFVVCEKPEFEGEAFDTLLNPKVIVEVVAPSTVSRDRGNRFHNYATTPTLTDYILVSEEDVHVDHFKKREVGWLLATTVDIDATLEIPSIGVSVSLKDLYAKVEFPADPVIP